MHVNLREYSVDSSSISEISDSNHNGEIDKSKFEFESKLFLYLSPFATFMWYIYIYIYIICEIKGTIVQTLYLQFSD